MSKGIQLLENKEEGGFRDRCCSMEKAAGAGIRYYSALKTMNQLEHVYLPKVSQYRFCQIMAENLPKLREEIKDISMSGLKDFLESIRKHSDKIGETAMKQAQEQKTFHAALHRQTNVSYRKPMYIINGHGSEDENELKSKSPMLEDEETEEEVLSVQDLVDFTPVYRCLHIYSVLVSNLPII
ncbi:hypothetical protein AB205_0032850 [Aquarana catesbeiana]|uniref:Exocyst complex component EXOC6/Sec15 N-terminal domain-containing protein n=1 Tax=Aquarana catesbeiana TaxID=8400 RepID=A0A2G9R6Y9_AQUCT|nr:hypothetical protein AB205_0032850 [Aquarana catesbeiana]